MTKKIDIKAVCAGVAVGITGSTLASFAVLAFWGKPLTPETFTVEKLEGFFSNALPSIVDLFLSLVAVFLSGYVAGKISKANPMPSVITVAVIQLVILVLMYLPNLNITPVWYTVISLLSLIPVAYWGGKSSMRVKS